MLPKKWHFILKTSLEKEAESYLPHGEHPSHPLMPAVGVGFSEEVNFKVQTWLQTVQTAKRRSCPESILGDKV